METYYTDNQSYAGATIAKLEGDRAGRSAASTAASTSARRGATGYTIGVTSKGSEQIKYTITNAAGVVTRTCPTASQQGRLPRATATGSHQLRLAVPSKRALRGPLRV